MVERIINHHLQWLGHCIPLNQITCELTKNKQPDRIVCIGDKILKIWNFDSGYVTFIMTVTLIYTVLKYCQTKKYALG